MATMTKRERCMRTIRFEETDRVPLYDIFQNDAITEHYAQRPLTTGPEGLHTVGIAVGRALDMTRMIAPPNEPHTWSHDGFETQVERYTAWTMKRPFHDMDTLKEWVKNQIRATNARTFDKTHAEQLYKHIEARWADFAEGDPTGRKDPTVFVLESGAGLTEMYHTAGWDLFPYLMMEDPELVEEWIEANNQCELRRVAAIADPHYIPIALTYDDIAHKTGTLFSPDWLRELFMPRLKRLNDAWHARGVYCLFHSDGNLWGVLDDLVAAGIDGLNPIEVLASMTPKAVREKYPNLFLAGGIDVSQLLTNGTPEEVREVCRQAIADTGGRGYFMGSTTELHWDVNLECAKAMFETAWESGNVPAQTA